MNICLRIIILKKAMNWRGSLGEYMEGLEVDREVDNVGTF